MLGCMVFIVPQLPPWGQPVAFFKSILKTPTTWAFIAALTYPLIQALNPAYTAEFDEAGKRILIPIEHIEWLPSGVSAPLTMGNPVRHLLMFGAIALTFISLRGVLTKRSSWISLLWIALINGSLMAFVGTLVAMSDGKKILWFIETVNHTFFGSLYYKNHAAATLYMTITIGWILYFYHARQTKTRGLKSGPHLLSLLLLVLTFFPVYMTGSKAGMVFTGAISILCVFLWVVEWLLHLREDGNLKTGLLISGTVVCILGTLVGTIGSKWIDIDSVQDQLFGLKADLEVLGDGNIEEASHSNRHRYIAMIAFYEMLKDRPAFGVGAGSFEHFSREYSQKYPDIHYAFFSRKDGGWTTWIWKDAHSDWLEYPIEYGYGGFALLLLALLVWLPGAFGTLKNPRIYFFVPWIGAGAMAGHAIFEFVFQLPLLVLLFMLVWSSPWFLYNLKRS